MLNVHEFTPEYTSILNLSKPYFRNMDIVRQNTRFMPHDVCLRYLNLLPALFTWIPTP